MFALDLAGKNALVLGVANQRSIAWGIAQILSQAGARIVLTYQNERLKEPVERLATDLPGSILIPCDVSDDQQLSQAFRTIDEKVGSLSIVVHSIAFADREDLGGPFSNLGRSGFRTALEISAYSLIPIVRHAALRMCDEGGNVLAMSFQAANQVFPGYNVMGVAKAALENTVRQLASEYGPRNIRVNAISAGPIKTLAASGIGDFRYILKWNELNAPLRRNVTIDEVGGAGVYFLSDLSTGVTGEVHHVDCGYHVVGMKHPDAPDISVA